jgi:UPF0755 protein
MRRLVGALSLLVVLFGASSAYYAQHLLNQPLFNEAATYVIKPGASVKQIASKVSPPGQGLVNSLNQIIVELYGRWATRNDAIKAGEFNIADGSNTKSFFATLIAGKVIEYTITIPEGWTFQEMLEKLTNLERIHHPSDGYLLEPLAKSLGIETSTSFEGLFFPDTYSYTDGVEGTEILRQAYTTMETQLAEAWADKTSSALQIKTSYEALILASIIEKETGVEGERGKISGVFHNRLRIGMMLQTDPTVIYGLGDKFDGNLRRVDLVTDTPYNTYTRFGLPPGPIALPGRLSLDAAVNPETTTALYFVADGHGGHTFSDTLKQHNQAVADYLRILRGSD